MGEIKSAFERAMEKVKTLGKLSPEEMKQRQEEEYTPVGRAVADRYLQHGYAHFFLEELGKYQGEEKDIVVRAALSRLVEAVQLRDKEVNERAIGGILYVKKEEKITPVREKLATLYQELQEIQRHRYEMEGKEIERNERDLLHQLRISGSAVGEINLEDSQAWKKRGLELSAQFEGRLNSLKQELAHLCQLEK